MLQKIMINRNHRYLKFQVVMLERLGLGLGLGF